MKYSFGKWLCSFVIIIVMFSCHRNASEIVSPKGVPFFKSENRMIEILMSNLSQSKVSKNLQILKIDYIENRRSSTQLITYSVDGKVFSNVAITQTGESLKMRECVADNCQCMLRIYTDEENNSVYECGGCNTNCRIITTDLSQL
jgi:hypothetical protein